MVAPMRASARRPANAPHVNDLVDELRVILREHDSDSSRRFLAEFAVRHRLTHRDVDALLKALEQDNRGSSDPDATSEAEPSGTADEGHEAVSDADFAWLFGDEPEPAPLRAV